MRLRNSGSSCTARRNAEASMRSAMGLHESLNKGGVDSGNERQSHHALAANDPDLGRRAVVQHLHQRYPTALDEVSRLDLGVWRHERFADGKSSDVEMRRKPG